jgi:hypothetical protein
MFALQNPQTQRFLTVVGARSSKSELIDTNGPSWGSIDDAARFPDILIALDHKLAIAERGMHVAVTGILEGRNDRVIRWAAVRRGNLPRALHGNFPQGPRRSNPSWGDIIYFYSVIGAVVWAAIVMLRKMGML